MNTKLKTLFISIILLVLVSIGVLLTLIFLIKKNKIATNISAQEVQQEESRSIQAKKITDILDRAKAPVETLKSYLVPDGNIVSVVEKIEQTGANIDIVLSNLSADDSSSLPVGSINKIKARLDGKGNWKNIMTFLNNLNMLPYKILISNVSLRSVEDKKIPVWNISLQIEILKIK